MADKDKRLIRALPPTRWEELHRLMVAQRFPSVPAAYAEAKPYFAQARIFALLGKREVQATFIFGPPQESVSFLDVVCAPDWHGLWATPGVLRQLYRLAFDTLGLKVVWVQPRRKAGLRAALQAGFVPGTPLGIGHPVLVMTPFGVPARYREKQSIQPKGDVNHGQFV